MQSGRPRLYLHIGRNKCGSTALQAYCFAQREKLKNESVQYALFGYPSPPGSNVPTFASHMVLADHLRSHSAEAVLISHEGICCFQHDVLRAMVADLSEFDTTVIFYIRPYRDWVVSSYKFDVRMGINGKDFDRYSDALSPTISIKAVLEIVGNTVGWENLRVRSTHPEDLVGGDLASDLMAAIGAPIIADQKAERLNVAPSWAAIEVMRALIGNDQASGWAAKTQSVAIVLHNLIDEISANDRLFIKDALYMSRTQATFLKDLYNSDLDFIEMKTGVALRRDDLNTAPERPFLPSIERIPRTVLCALRQKASSADVAMHHPDVTAFVNSSKFNGYCEGRPV